MADANGKISTSVMERLIAAAAAKPYESVSSLLFHMQAVPWI